MREIIDVLTKNNIHSGAIDRGFVVFSPVMFVPRDLDSVGLVGVAATIQLVLFFPPGPPLSRGSVHLVIW